MHTRLAEARDLHRLTEITTSSLVDDPTFDYMWPYWREFTEDNFVWWQLTLQRWLYDPKTLFLVTILDEDDLPADTSDGDDDSSQTVRTKGCQETIVAYAIWERWSRSRMNSTRWRKRSPMKLTLEQKVNNRIDMACTIWQQWSLARISPRRDADPAHVQALFDTQGIITEDLWSDVNALWNLTLLVTHRSYRRRGAASKLMEGVMQLADDEKVHCRVEASPMGKLLYESCEFKELEVRVVKTKDDAARLPVWCMRRSPPLTATQSS